MSERIRLSKGTKTKLETICCLEKLDSLDHVVLYLAAMYFETHRSNSGTQVFKQEIPHIIHEKE